MYKVVEIYFLFLFRNFNITEGIFLSDFEKLKIKQNIFSDKRKEEQLWSSNFS